uniref:Peptidase C39-like domain-containing protein n=1 Tax=Chromera velia CCMP2878 TaxID=1169474 RepID=A0A0G4F2F2_9ALVE|eukprot:Cvel_14755.t1-p1 / transcript=Cvel_14755.t1 / gene=Cvel_14755 / organism=Chromera_velia_CCMP2878 / gene_product=hypothetical protein / transcript_product=hypothetical protein / location=Cvel_scaffold1061:55049-56955(-) / protein_length=370 / sequence_SO=supercontig / SO=protein_coding / is_pseudo=false
MPIGAGRGEARWSSLTVLVALFVCLCLYSTQSLSASSSSSSFFQLEKKSRSSAELQTELDLLDQKAQCPNADKWGTTGRWSHAAVTRSIKRVVQGDYWEKITQGRANWCGFMSIVRMLAAVHPEIYVRLFRQIYCHGKWPKRMQDTSKWYQEDNGFDDAPETIINMKTGKLRVKEDDLGNMRAPDAILAYALNEETNLLMSAGPSAMKGGSTSGALMDILSTVLPEGCSEAEKMDEGDIIEKLKQLPTVRTPRERIAAKKASRAALDKTPIILLTEPFYLNAWMYGPDPPDAMSFMAHWVRLTAVFRTGPDSWYFEYSDTNANEKYSNVFKKDNRVMRDVDEARLRQILKGNFGADSVVCHEGKKTGLQY